MKLSEFSFDLPSQLIAQHPTDYRSDSKLLVANRATKSIEHKKFEDIVDIFGDGDVFVINDTKVFPARLYGSKEKTGAQIEVFLLRELNPDQHLWDAMVDPARKIRVGNKLYFNDGELIAEVIDNTTSRGRTIRFLFDGTSEDLMDVIHLLGETPLPREIRQNVVDADRERFQTIYAKKMGAIAAPAAGLHFTKNVMRKLEIKGAKFAPLTLHIGLGTYRTIDVEDLTKHKPESEYFVIEDSTAQVVNEALDKNKKIIAVGTTSLKSIESSVSSTHRLKSVTGWTDKFIFPPYEFKITNALLTNFHLPESILYMTTCAFGGYDFVKDIYKEAMEKEYRFFSYGDAMLIL